ncbi:hypothetical protein EUGRSUZ_C01954 [Eucalyptus grandis]|uniref:Uncharacterized protein n=2 Tax=Eucalyptus grandis TaxID=71139 RepID=A0ACC3LE13_EUCGR|nr:hypothetical protein EUGRSUZ_C01954 [Eucalyptus grandis]
MSLRWYYSKVSYALSCKKRGAVALIYGRQRFHHRLRRNIIPDFLKSEGSPSLRSPELFLRHLSTNIDLPNSLEALVHSPHEFLLISKSSRMVVSQYH